MVLVVVVLVALKVQRDIAAKGGPMVWAEQAATRLRLMPVVGAEVLPVAVVEGLLGVETGISTVAAVVPPDALEVQVEMVEMVQLEQ